MHSKPACRLPKFDREVLGEQQLVRAQETRNSAAIMIITRSHEDLCFRAVAQQLAAWSSGMILA